MKALQLCLTFALFGFATNAHAESKQQAAAGSGPGTIGVSLPLTGPAATYGTDIRGVLSFLNERDGGKLHFIFEDDRCNGAEAARVVEKFISVDHVRAVTGLPCSGTVLATASIFERSKVVGLSAGAGAPSISQAGEYIFRTRPSDVHSANLLAAHVLTRHPEWHRMVLLAEETELAQGLANAFTESVAKSPASSRPGTQAALEIVRESFLSEASDLQAQLLRLRSRKPDAILIFSQSEKNLIEIVRKIRIMKWDTQILSSIFPGSRTFLDALGQDANGITYSVIAGKGSFTESGRKLLDEYESTHGPLKSVDYGFSVAQAAYRVLADTISEPDLKTALLRGTFDGVAGPFTFDANGDLVGMHYDIMRIVDGTPRTIER